jgi:hypothetical protein
MKVIGLLLKILIPLYCATLLGCLNPLTAPEVNNGVEIVIGYNPEDTVAPSRARTITPIGFQDELDYLIRFQDTTQDSNGVRDTQYFVISNNSTTGTGNTRRRVLLETGNYYIDVVGFVGGTISGSSPTLTEALFDDWDADSEPGFVFGADGGAPVIPTLWQVAGIYDKIVATGQTINGNFPNQVNVPRGDIIQIPVPLKGFTDRTINSAVGTLSYHFVMPNDMTGKDTAGGDENTYDEAWVEMAPTAMINSDGTVNYYNADGSDTTSYNTIEDLEDLSIWAGTNSSLMSTDILYIIPRAATSAATTGYTWVGPNTAEADFVQTYWYNNFFNPAATPVTTPTNPTGSASYAPGFYTVTATVIKRLDAQDVREATKTDVLHLYQGATTYLDWSFLNDSLSNAPGGTVTVNYEDTGDRLFTTDLVTLYKDWDDDNDGAYTSDYDWESRQKTVTISWNTGEWNAFNNFRVEIDGETWRTGAGFASMPVNAGGTIATLAASVGFKLDVADFQLGNHAFTLKATERETGAEWSKRITVRSEHGPGLWKGDRLVKILNTSATTTAAAPYPDAIPATFIENALTHIQYAGAPSGTNWYINFTGEQTLIDDLNLTVNQNITLSGIAATTNNAYSTAWPNVTSTGTLFATLGANHTLVLTGQMYVKGTDNESRMITVGNATANLVLSGNTRLQGQTGGALSITAGKVVLNDLATIIDNTVTGSTDGGGISLTGAGSLTMNGGIIAGNTSNDYGGGIYIAANASIRFAKNGGIIYGIDDLTNANTGTTEGAALNFNSATTGNYRNRNKTIGTGDKLLYTGGVWTLWNNDPPD